VIGPTDPNQTQASPTQGLEAVQHVQSLELCDLDQNPHGAQPELVFPGGGLKVSRVLSAHPDDGALAQATAGLGHNVELLLLEHDHRTMSPIVRAWNACETY
jgi:hypothetical protein